MGACQWCVLRGVGVDLPLDLPLPLPLDMNIDVERQRRRGRGGDGAAAAAVADALEAVGGGGGGREERGGKGVHSGREVGVERGKTRENAKGKGKKEKKKKKQDTEKTPYWGYFCQRSRREGVRRLCAVEAKVGFLLVSFALLSVRFVCVDVWSRGMRWKTD